MSTSYPEAIREGTVAAARLHAQLRTQSRIAKDSPASIDVLDAALEIDLPVLFRPLQGLLGAYLAYPTPGILVTTRRPLSIQRFTAAHEVGHFFMRHSPSVDDEGVLRRGMLNIEEASDNFQEVEANAFAAAFLMPKWLVAAQCAHHGWTGKNLRSAQAIYQLSLRLGASYEATCWSLSRYKFLTIDEARSFAAIEPRSLKIELLGGVKPKDYRGDTWLLTERDQGTVIAGAPNDHFVLRLTEHAGGGYLWDFAELQQSGFVELRNTAIHHDHEGIGSPFWREVVASSPPAIDPPGLHPLLCRLVEARPWESAHPLNTLQLRFDLAGPEAPGFSRAERRRLLEAA